MNSAILSTPIFAPVAADEDNTLDSPTAPPVGIHPGVHADLYHGWDAVSSSQLKELKRSPAHLRHYLLAPQDKESFRVGRATHTAVLEPHLFESCFVRAPEGDKRTKAVKEAWERLETDHPHATILKSSQYDDSLRMRDEVWAHPEARAMLEAATHKELSIAWDDGTTGLRCKARPDLLLPHVLCDLKSSADASPDAFSRSILNFHYYLQLAFYLDGLDDVGVSIDEVRIIAVESSAPYAVGVYRLAPEWISQGRHELPALLASYRECKESNLWPSYSPEVVDIHPPRWAFR